MFNRIIEITLFSLVVLGVGNLLVGLLEFAAALKGVK